MNSIKFGPRVQVLSANFKKYQLRNFNCLTRLDTSQNANPTNPPNFANSQLLEFSLERVPQLGFTEQAIERSCLSLDYPDLPTQFEGNGAIQLIKHYLVTRRLNTLESVKNIKSNSDNKLNKDELIKICFKTRLELSKPYIGKWSDAVALLSTNQEGIKLATMELYNLIDDFLFISGDKSADMSWYYKRLIYSKVFTASEIYMTEDKSLNYKETFKFLETQLNDIKLMGNGLNDASNLIQFFGKSLVGVINSTGRNL